MSVESAKAYIEKVKTDEEFRNKIAATTDKEERAAILKAEGFDFTEEDVNAISSDELSDEELDKVAGGYGCSFRPECEFWF